VRVTLQEDQNNKFGKQRMTQLDDDNIATGETNHSLCSIVVLIFVRRYAFRQTFQEAGSFLEGFYTPATLDLLFVLHQTSAEPLCFRNG
jgi:hypothetical protein